MLVMPLFEKQKQTGIYHDRKLPPLNAAKIEQTITTMRDVCREFDRLHLVLDDLMAQIELDISNSPLTAYRSGKKPPKVS